MFEDQLGLAMFTLWNMKIDPFTPYEPKNKASVAVFSHLASTGQLLCHDKDQDLLCRWVMLCEL